MLNWRILSESQDEELQQELELDCSLSQPPIRTLLSVGPALLHERQQEEVGSSRPFKQPRVEQRRHQSLQQDVHTLVMTLEM